MKRLTIEQVHAQKIKELGLDPEAVDLTTPEGLSGALRRAASYLCPCSATTLLRAVVRPLVGLVPNIDKTEELAEETLEAMISHGDVLEQPEIADGLPTSRVLVYGAPASFVVRDSGLVLLLGVAIDHLSPLPPELECRIEYLGHVRRISPTTEAEDLRKELLQIGLFEISSRSWLRGPKHKSASQFLVECDLSLNAAQPSREVPGLLLLDSDRPVKYYRGRWVNPGVRSGRFVARRPQAYGADLWCYVQLTGGQPERLIDLPKLGWQWRGCDEAWHMQMAIDAVRASPQRFRTSQSGDDVVLEFFSPVPGWARRRWDAIGESVPITGSLFAYRMPRSEFEQERKFLQDELWLAEI